MGELGADKPATLRDVDTLKSHFDSRFKSMEHWLERVSNSIDKLADNRERVLIVETQVATIQTQLLSMIKNAKEEERKVDDVKGDVIRIMTVGSIGMLLITIVVPVVVTLIVERML